MPPTDGADADSTGTQRLPWYDAGWLSRYRAAESLIRSTSPTALPAFVDALRALRTRPDFEVTLLDRPFDDNTMETIRHTVASLSPADLELHEARRFGRFVVHDHPYFNELQARIVPLVSKVVGEAVEPAYNFLSLYAARGICGMHLDSPQAKWTLDLCIDQHAPWPIHFSQVVQWPEGADDWSDGWADRIRRSPANRFSSCELQPGQAVVFSGSSQWHYRDAIPQTAALPFCRLLFFHFIPKGTAELADPRNWARLFGIPELAQLTERKSRD